MPTENTRERLLDAALNLFVKHGIGGTSLRAITTRAGTNLASVNYHFGTKDNLIHAVFARHLEPCNRERIDMLDRLEQCGQPPKIESILEAFFAPPLRMFHADPRSRDFPQLIPRLYAEPEDLQQAIFNQFDEVKTRFTAAFKNALPHLPPEELLWRFQFLIGAMAHTFCAPQILNKYAQAHWEPADYDNVLKRLIAFTAAGLHAPIPDLTGEPV